MASYALKGQKLLAQGVWGKPSFRAAWRILRLVQVFEDEFYLVAGEVVEALALLGTLNGGKQGGNALDPA